GPAAVGEVASGLFVVAEVAASGEVRVHGGCSLRCRVSSGATHCTESCTEYTSGAGKGARPPARHAPPPLLRPRGLPAPGGEDRGPDRRQLRAGPVPAGLLVVPAGPGARRAGLAGDRGPVEVAGRHGRGEGAAAVW